MKKYILFSLLSLLSFGKSYCQPSIVTTVHQEREQDPMYFENVKLLNNGNTAYIKYKGAGGFGVRLFDKDHKMISQSLISSKYWNTNTIKGTSVRAVYSIKNDLVIFFQQTCRKHPILFRLVIDGTTSKLKSETMLGVTKNRITYFKTKLRGTVNKESHCYFHIAKDKNSDCYAITYSDNLKKKDDNIVIQLYNADHKLLNAAHIKNNKYDRVDILDIQAVGDSCAYSLVRAFKNKKKDETLILLNKVSNSQNGCITKQLDLNEYNKLYVMGAFLRYNSETKKLQALLSGEIDQKYTKGTLTTYISNIMAYISPNDMNVNAINEIDNKKINESAKAAGKDIEFSGPVYYMDVNNKNETILLKEHIGVRVIEHRDNKGNTHYSTLYDLGQIGVSILSPSGEETGSYFLDRTTYTTRNRVDDDFLKNSIQKIWAPITLNISENYSNNDMIGFNYASGAKNNYIFYNDYKKKIEGSETDLKRKDKKSKDYNALVYSLRNNNFTKDYLMGQPKEKSSKALNPFAFDSNDNEAVALILSKDKKNTTTDIVWFKLD